MRRVARFHSLNNFAEPATVSASAVGARTESYRSPDARAEQAITEDQYKEMRGGEHRVFQLRRPSSLFLRSANPAGMHSFSGRLEHADCHRPVALAGKNQPCEHARDSSARSDFVKTIEHAFDVGFLRARPSLEELRLKLSDAAQNHRFDKTFAAAEVMKDRGMRDAGVGGDFLKAYRLRTSAKQTTLRCFKDRVPSLGRASTASSRGTVPDGASRRMAPGANARSSRSGGHPF
jgi:hypothetical protein